MNTLFTWKFGQMIALLGRYTFFSRINSKYPKFIFLFVLFSFKFDFQIFVRSKSFYTKTFETQFFRQFQFSIFISILFISNQWFLTFGMKSMLSNGKFAYNLNEIASCRVVTKSLPEDPFVRKCDKCHTFLHTQTMRRKCLSAQTQHL